MKRLLTILLLTTLTIALINAADYSQKDLMTKLRTAQSQDQADPIFDEFVRNAPNLEFAYEIYKVWSGGSPAKAQACLDAMRADDKLKNRVLYFEGVAIENILERIEFARNLIKQDKDMFEGYALMFDTYTRWLFMRNLETFSPDSSPSEAELKALDEGFKENTEMVRIRDWRDAGEHLSLCHKYMGYYAEYKRHYDDALKHFKAGEKLGADWVNPVHIAIVAVRLNKKEEATEYIGKFADLLIEKGAIKPTMKQMVIDDVTFRVLINGGAYDDVIARITSKAGYEKDPVALYDLAAVYARKQDSDKAYDNLNAAIDNGFDDKEQLAKDQDFKKLRNDSRWKDVMAKVEVNWKEGEAKRSQAALKTRIDKPAADWELKDTDGKSYKLSDYAGKKVVILDFWATWCGPCMQAMPALDKWCKTHKPDDVEVFSINTWERNPDQAKKIFIEKRYAMTLLMGGDDAAKNYGVTGIPYICVIGKDGKIHYEMKGFSPELESNLSVWVKDLLK